METKKNLRETKLIE